MLTLLRTPVLVPHVDVALLPGERFVEAVRLLEEQPLQTVLSVEHELLRLCRVESLEIIGTAGPALASIGPEQHGDELVPQELRLYEAIFGRDSLAIANDLVDYYPQLARTTLLTHAMFQGVSFHEAREEEPGRMFHEMRSKDDVIAQQITQERGWDWPYYGNVDCNASFVRLLQRYCETSPEGYDFLETAYVDRAKKNRTIAQALDAALGWLEYRMDSNDEGIVEFCSPLPHGIENQVWKDSWDAYHHADGTLAHRAGGVSSVEVQASTYEALVVAAELYKKHLANPARATTLMARAERLKQAILALYWVQDPVKGGYFALGTDRDQQGAIRQLSVRTSNMGHVLNTALLDGDEPPTVALRDAVVRQLQTPEMLAAAGVRTLASDELRFRAGAYQNGSVWPWDTHIIANGLRRHGYSDFASDLDRRLMKAVETTGLLSEYFRGEDVIALNTTQITLYDDTNHKTNVVEQVPQLVFGATTSAYIDARHLITKGFIP